MDLRHHFTVPTSVEETWARFQDVADLAECFPGATVTSVEGDTFAGSAKVKLGPIALVYNGSGTFVEKDEATHRMVLEAKGKDKRGNGTAGATVTLTMTEGGSGTDVEVLTDLSVTGKPAQFGRGVMQDVSDKLLGQFVACLERRLAAPPEPPADEPAAAPSSGEPVTVSGVKNVSDAPPVGGSPSDQAPSGEPVTVSGAKNVSDAPLAGAASTRAPHSPPPDDAINLGTDVLPVLARTYWKPLLAAGVVLLVLRRVLR